MKNKEYIIKAISRLSVSIEYLTWALESETNEGQIEWLNEAVEQMANAEHWIEKSNILPF